LVVPTADIGVNTRDPLAALQIKSTVIGGPIREYETNGSTNLEYADKQRSQSPQNWFGTARRRVLPAQNRRCQVSIFLASSSRHRWCYRWL